MSARRATPADVRLVLMTSEQVAWLRMREQLRPGPNSAAMIAAWDAAPTKSALERRIMDAIDAQFAQPARTWTADALLNAILNAVDPSLGREAPV